MKTILIIFILIINSLIHVKGQWIEGFIYEKKQQDEAIPLAGANVVWLGTTIGTSTNQEGYFKVERPKGNERLLVSFIVFGTDTLTIPTEQSFLRHTMQTSLSLDEVTIKGMAPGAHFDRLNPVQTQIVTRQELNRAACCNLSESFETNASVDVSYSDAITGAKQIQLLGLAGTYSQIQVENIPALRGLSSTYGLSHVPGSWMESIQISKGTASVANGYESISGQINVEYKKPWDDEMLFVNGYANSLGMAEANANLSFLLSPRVSTMVLARAANMSMEVDHNHDTFLDHPKTKQYHFLNRWKYDANDFESQVGIRLLDEERNSGQLASNHVINPFEIEINTRQYEGFAKTGYIFDRPNTTVGLITSISHHEQKSIFGTSTYNGLQQSLYSNLVFITYLGRTNHTIKTGVSFVHDSYKETLNSLNTERKETVPGAYLEYSYKWLDKLTFLAGSRIDNHSLFGNLFTPRMHVCYTPIKQINIRASAGKGFKSSNVIAENMYLLASTKNLIFLEDIRIEEAWTIGLNLIQRYRVFDRELTISTDFYRTDFINQLIVDMDKDPFNVYFYNLKGESFSNNFQLEASYSPLERFDVTLAYRLNDVKSTINGKLVTKPLVSRYKGFISTSYKTPTRLWQFDYTIHLNGGGRLPETNHLPLEMQRGETFPAFITMNLQVSRNLKKWDTYIGVENLTGFTQQDPIIFAHNPYSPFFDASMIWGPLNGRKIYIGFRYLLERN